MNYQKELDKLLAQLEKEERVPSLLLHSCCAPVSYTHLLYVYDYKREAVSVCDLFKNESFDGNYTLWDNIDHAWCLKARILREQGDLNESKQIIEFVNQYRKPELYKNGVDWFLNTLDINIQSNLGENCKAGAKSWRLLKLELAIAYREAGKYPVSDDELEMIIKELKELLSKEK